MSVTFVPCYELLRLAPGRTDRDTTAYVTYNRLLKWSALRGPDPVLSAAATIPAIREVTLAEHNIAP